MMITRTRTLSKATFKASVQSCIPQITSANFWIQIYLYSSIQDIYIATRDYQLIIWLFWIISDHFWSSAYQYALSLTIVSGSYWQISIGARFEWIRVVAQEICWNKPHEAEGSAGKEVVNSRARERISGYLHYLSLSAPGPDSPSPARMDSKWWVQNKDNTNSGMPASALAVVI